MVLMVWAVRVHKRCQVSDTGGLENPYFLTVTHCPWSAWRTTAGAINQLRNTDQTARYFCAGRLFLLCLEFPLRPIRLMDDPKRFGMRTKYEMHTKINGCMYRSTRDWDGGEQSSPPDAPQPFLTQRFPPN